MESNTKKITGKNVPIDMRLGRWTLLAHVPHPKYRPKEAYGRWRCECGTERTIRMASVTSGQSRSCGCVSQQKMRAMAQAHSNEVMR